MSVAGIDFGNLNMLIGQTSKGGVDVILNESSNRQTATCVSISGKQRFLGDAGAAMARSNVKNTITLMKLLVGRKFEDPAVQKILAECPFNSVKMPSGGVGIEITYNDEPMTVSVEHCMGMVLVKANQISAAANGAVGIADSVLGVPHWFTESQKRGVMQACEIAQLNCLKVASESSLIALSYGIFKSAKKLFSETEPTHVMFIDIGYTGYCVSIVDFIQENMKVVATVCEYEVCGRNFDNIIVEYLCEVFEKKTKIDVRKNKKAILKLQAAAEKAKKTLSPAGVNETQVSVECLAEDQDLATTLTREEFETRSAPLVAKLAVPVQQALQEAGLTREQLNEIEIVGGTTRINIVKRTLGEILGLDAGALNYGLKTTMNADEAVARGGALQSALLSSRMKVKPFNIVDRMPYGVVAHFDAVGGEESSTGEDGEDAPAAKGTSVSLYSKGDEVPHKPRRLTFKNRTTDFSVTLTYDDSANDILTTPELRFLSKHTIKIPAELVAAAPGSDVRLTWNLDRNGCVYVQSAQFMEEVKVPAEGEAPAEGKEGEPVSSKKRFKKTDLEVVVQTPGLSPEEMKKTLELEASMAFEDKLITETADKRNELESYIYKMRDNLDGIYKTFCSADEKKGMLEKVNGAEDWVYNEGFDSTKQEYTRRLEELQQFGGPIERRYQEHNNRPTVIDGLKKQIEYCKSFCANYGDAYSHITEEERSKLRTEVTQTEEWMYDKISEQGNTPAHVDPVLTVDLINGKRNTLFSVSKPIMNKPKPKPADTTPPPAPEEKKEASAEEGKSEEKSESAEGKTEGKAEAPEGK